MAADEAPIVHPGDIVQDSEGLFYLASEVHSWGVGAVMRWREPDGEIRETYSRLKPGQFVPVGLAHTMPTEIAQARRDSLATAREIAKEAGQPDKPL